MADNNNNNNMAPDNNKDYEKNFDTAQLGEMVEVMEVTKEVLGQHAKFHQKKVEEGKKNLCADGKDLRVHCYHYEDNEYAAQFFNNAQIDLEEGLEKMRDAIYYAKSGNSRKETNKMEVQSRIDLHQRHGEAVHLLQLKYMGEEVAELTGDVDVTPGDADITSPQKKCRM